MDPKSRPTCPPSFQTAGRGVQNEDQQKLNSALQLIGILPTIAPAAAWIEKLPFRPNPQIIEEAVPVAVVVSIVMLAVTLVLTRRAANPSRGRLFGWLVAFFLLDLVVGIVWWNVAPGLGGRWLELVVNIGLWSMTFGVASVWVTLAIRLRTGKAPFVFEVVIEPDKFEDGSPAFHAYCPLLPGCHTWGDTYHEALIKVQEAASLCAEDMLESGEAIPVPRSELAEGARAEGKGAPTVIVHA